MPEQLKKYLITLMPFNWYIFCAHRRSEVDLLNVKGMKWAICLGLVMLIAFQADVYGQKKRNLVKVKSDTTAVDSVTYELVVMDPGFETWLATKPQMNYYSKSYYENWNKLYVIEWNYRYSDPLRFGSLYESRIEYDPSVDYGLELNYRLYYFFLYFEAMNHVKLLTISR